MAVVGKQFPKKQLKYCPWAFHNPVSSSEYNSSSSCTSSDSENEEPLDKNLQTSHGDPPIDLTRPITLRVPRVSLPKIPILLGRMTSRTVTRETPLPAFPSLDLNNMDSSCNIRREHTSDQGHTPPTVRREYTSDQGTTQHSSDQETTPPPSTVREHTRSQRPSPPTVRREVTSDQGPRTVVTSNDTINEHKDDDHCNKTVPTKSSLCVKRVTIKDMWDQQVTSSNLSVNDCLCTSGNHGEHSGNHGEHSGNHGEYSKGSGPSSSLGVPSGSGPRKVRRSPRKKRTNGKGREEMGKGKEREVLGKEVLGGREREVLGKDREGEVLGGGEREVLSSREEEEGGGRESEEVLPSGKEKEFVLVLSKEDERSSARVSVRERRKEITKKHVRDSENNDPFVSSPVKIKRINKNPRYAKIITWDSDESSIHEEEEEGEESEKTPPSRLPVRPPCLRRRHRESLVFSSKSPSPAPSRASVNISNRPHRGVNFERNRSSKFNYHDIVKLVEGVNKYGGRGARISWSRIMESHAFEEGLTTVMVKDKWRTLVRFNHVRLCDDGKYELLK